MASQKLSTQRAKCAWVVLVALVVTSLAPVVTTPASASTSKTVMFSQGSSALSSTAKRQVMSWKSSLNTASKITVTGYAPKAGSRNVQTTLALKRATAVVAQFQTIGIKATFTKKTVLLTTTIKKMQSANKAVIVVTSVKPVVKPSTSPTASPSASASISPSASSSPSSSPSPTESPRFKVSNKLILSTYDVGCGGTEKQIIFNSASLMYQDVATPSASPTIVATQNFDSSETGFSSDPGVTNCAVTWNFESVLPGQYMLRVSATCKSNITDAEFTPARLCTPSSYDAAGNVVGRGVGPTSSGDDAIMTFDLDVVVNSDGSTASSTFYENLYFISG